MSNAIYVNADVSDDERRQRLFAGQLFVYTPRPSSLAFVQFARMLIEEAFAPFAPQSAQDHLSVEAYAKLLAALKPYFIHHPDSKRYIKDIFVDMGCELEKYYFDVPKMRSSTSHGYLTTGIAYAWHPHRDTWYSAPSCQINWWIPIYDIRSDNAMAFHPAYWNRAVRNSSSGYNYYRWNEQHRGAHVAAMLKEDPRPLPKALEALDLDPQIRLIVPAGGIILFSAAHMHSSVPNTSGVTRFSIDFRTVHLDDVTAKCGAPRVDEECTGTTMRDYLHATDFAHLSEELIALYDDNTTDQGKLSYDPNDSDPHKPRGQAA
jgi:hypothetical protein